LLIERGRSKQQPNRRCTQIAEKSPCVESAEDIEDRVGPGLRVGGASKSGLVTILATKTEDERTVCTAKSSGVAKTKQEIAVAKIGARGRQRRRGRQRVGAVYVNVGVVY